MKNFKSVSYKDVKLTGGFWYKWQDTVASSTLDSVYNQFNDSGRISAMTLNWRTGDTNRPHIFYDSDIAKWIEGAAYSLHIKKNQDAEDRIDAIVNLIEDGMSDEGYFNSYYQTIEPMNRWTVRVNHELYCAGHLMEAAVAYFEATGKRKFLDLMCRYADYIEQIFKLQKNAAFDTPGHEEIELALVRLYHATGEKRYLELAKYFIDTRGTSERDKTYDAFDTRYAQDNQPVRFLDRAEGHAVRYAYLFAAAADIAREYGDEELLNACKRTFNDAVEKKMYVTGGMGNMAFGEAFGPDYYLPNFQAYTETCASIAFAFIAQRMLRMEPDRKYADILELELYNGALAGISLDGKSFFYENPLEQKPSVLRYFNEVKANYRPVSRVELFSCSCCPPNILRIIAGIGEYFYSTDGDTVYTHLYNSGKADIKLNNGSIRLTQTTKYPDDGKIVIKVGAKEPVMATLAFRIPSWCKYSLVYSDGKMPDKIENGYAYFTKLWRKGDSIELNFQMDIRLIEAKPEVSDNCGKVAIMRGPLVYCLEEIDNGKNLSDIRLSKYPSLKTEYNKELLGGLNVITFKGTKRSPEKWDTSIYREYVPSTEEGIFKAVPYYAWNNRGEGEITVWIQI